MQAPNELYVNGIDGESGEYLLPRLSCPLVAAVARGGRPDPSYLDEFRRFWWRASQPHYAPIEGADPCNLDETGWGVIFAFRADPAIGEALAPLLDLRRGQATRRHEHYYKENSGASAYRPAESKQQFLARQGAGPGPADPDRVPYYLLIVGDPESIPNHFQYQLDVPYAVGRIHFDTPSEYAHYPRNVVEAETGGGKRPMRAAFFGVRNPDDRATELSTDLLIRPLAEALAEDSPDWEILSILEGESTKARLGKLLGGEETPALVFTASHGMGFCSGHPRQALHQGALLCQDWPGPIRWRRPIPPDFYFAADDVSQDARLLGLIAFDFACYSAGTPRLDDFSKGRSGPLCEIAPRTFLARLPQRMLGDQAGALAVIGHVERAWSCSFLWDGAGRQVAALLSTLRRLLNGYPVGSAVEYLNQRHAALSCDLTAELEAISFGKQPDEPLLAGLWTANNDARNFVIRLYPE
jgi:hypothetical protein